MNFKHACIWTFSLFELACASKPSSVIVLNAPHCESASDDLTSRLNEQAQLLRQAFGKQVRAVNVVDGRDAVFATMALSTPRLIVYSGHGKSNKNASPRRAELCIAKDALAPEELLAPAERSTSREGRNDVVPVNSTLVVNACYSHYVDLRDKPSGLSIISSSFDELSVNSRFAEALAHAVEDRSLDANCDGIVTDEELFNKINTKLHESELRKDFVPAVELRAQPLLRRHARGQVPLPITSRCERIALAPRILVAQGEDDLKRALGVQEQYARAHSGLYPVLDWDYFTIVKRADVSSADEEQMVKALTEGRRSAMLRQFKGTHAEAAAVAKYAVFTEVYAVEMYPPAIRVVRLRDNSLVGTRMSMAEAISDVFPFRDQTYFMQGSKQQGNEGESRELEQGTFRILRDSDLSSFAKLKGWQPLPCVRTLVGECFRKEEVNAANPLPPPSETSSRVNRQDDGSASRGSGQ